MCLQSSELFLAVNRLKDVSHWNNLRVNHMSKKKHRFVPLTFSQQVNSLEVTPDRSMIAAAGE